MAFDTTAPAVGDLTFQTFSQQLLTNDDYLKNRQQITVYTYAEDTIATGNELLIRRMGLMIPANKTCKLYRVMGWGPYTSLKWRLTYDPTGTPAVIWTGDSGTNQAFGATPDLTVFDNSAGAAVTKGIAFLLYNDSGSNQTIDTERATLMAEFVYV